MDKNTMSYDWEAYYRAVTKKEKIQKNSLEEQLAEVEAKEAELLMRLQNIENNRFWRLYISAREKYHRLRHRNTVADSSEAAGSNAAAADSNHLAGNHAVVADNNNAAGQSEAVSEQALAAMRAYEQEVFRQRHPYLQMIAPQNKDFGEWIPVNGWKVLPLENTDICIVFCGKGLFHSSYMEEIKSWFNDNKTCLFAYADEDYYWNEITNRMHPWFKPDWSPDTLLAFCYTGHMIAVNKSLAGDSKDRLPANWTVNSGSEMDFYDICLRLEEAAREKGCTIGHIDKVLFHNQYEAEIDTDSSDGKEEIASNISNSNTDVLEMAEKQLQKELEQGRYMPGIGAAFCEIRNNALQRRSIKAHLESGLTPEVYHVVYEDTPTISIVIPSKDHPEVLEQCLASFRTKTEYDPAKYEWIVVDNGSSAENKQKIEALQKEYGFVYLYQPMEFNFSAMCNLGVSKAKGECILLLNDDIEIIQKDWLRIMAGQAVQPHVGAVGAKLWYAGSEMIQHTGITNMKIGPSHKLVTFADDRNYYYGHNQVTYDMLGVTAAALMVERRKYEAVGGLDESMKVSYNDVDFCFKLAEAGYYNVLRNDAVLYHHESLSRGLDEEDEGKWDRLLQEKEKLFAKHPKLEGKDIFYHKNLVDNESDYTCNFKFDCKNNLKETDYSVEDAKQLALLCQNGIQLTVDRAEKQHKIHRNEPDFMYMMGWSYMPGKDNALFKRHIVLQKEEGTFLKVEPFLWHRKDVEEVLPEEKNVSLAGFVVRIRKENLQKGIWRIGMMAEDLADGKQFLTWSDKTWNVE